jgi:hypothetical protein
LHNLIAYIIYRSSCNMDKINKIAVLIPFYKQRLTVYENIALQQCFKVLSAYSIIAIKPYKLVLPAEVVQYKFDNIISFPDEYFEDIQGYNRLMLDAVFYREFLNCEYILIHQLDAFVFRDELNSWCNRDLDYIGAPWMRKKEYSNIFKAIVSNGLQYLAKRYNIKKRGLPSKKQFDNSVGNGGFSLRKVDAFSKICLAQQEKIAFYNKQISHHYNEDVFWSIEVNRKKKLLNIPDYKTALQFAFELAPERAYHINHNQLPFGCHAWDLQLDFWRPFFKDQGYEI